ncbi:MAG: hypothetical protein CL969_00160 [Euryarchaeota archaeon]|jgi:hypothetical protein|nr:hypothetical protein [Euryarchaeota archaeon]MDP6575182.1 hypothetical protein [Candidatus Peribacteraceae bacterium]HCI03293.1 hypothetical protein [Candidatus Peribacteria bacterium]|tara:strand:- start:3065 stop:3703 length:639 start_codon:yes stop_codon:yes gene_type:complete
MPKTNTKTSATHPSVGDVLHHVSVPFLIFTAVLLGFLSLSATLILPQLTQVDIAGKEHDAVELKELVKKLDTRVQELERARGEFVTPLREGLFGDAMDQKYNSRDLLLFKSQLEEITQQIETASLRQGYGRRENKDTISISSMTFDQEELSLKVEGKVQNVGPRSMTVLAQFINAAQESKWVSDISPPKFTREHDDENGFYSPFIFTLLLSE